MIDDSLPAKPFVAWLREYFTAAEGNPPDDEEFKDLVSAYELNGRVRTLPIPG